MSAIVEVRAWGATAWRAVSAWAAVDAAARAAAVAEALGYETRIRVARWCA